MLKDEDEKKKKKIAVLKLTAHQKLYFFTLAIHLKEILIQDLFIETLDECYYNE